MKKFTFDNIAINSFSLQQTRNPKLSIRLLYKNPQHVCKDLYAILLINLQIQYSSDYY
jgi:hypothetical protein